MPRQKFDIAYLIANHHLAFTKMKPLSEMEVTHVVNLGHTAYVHMHSQQDSCNVRRKRNLHMIYSAIDPYRILHVRQSTLLSMTVYHCTSCVCIRFLQHGSGCSYIVCHIMDPYIIYLTCGSPLLSISSAKHSTRFLQHGLGLLPHMVLPTIPSLH